jgi:hypothetical protein
LLIANQAKKRAGILGGFCKIAGWRSGAALSFVRRFEFFGDDGFHIPFCGECNF